MLKLSTKYALAVISYLSSKEKNEFVRVKQIATKGQIPQAYLSQVVKILVSNKLLAAKAGPGGGIRLSMRKKVISIYDVCIASQDPICKDICFLNNSKCDSANHCLRHSAMQELKKITFSSISEPEF